MRRCLLPCALGVYIGLLIPFLPAAITVSYRAIGSSCTSNAVCPANSYCYLENGNNTCVCNRQYTPSPNLQECLARVGTMCGCDTSISQCNSCVPHAFCNLEKNNGTCMCERGFTPSETMDKCMAGIGADCSDSECIPNSSCGGNSEKPTCICDPNWVPSENGDKCLSRVDGDCSSDGDCIENASCFQRTCLCPKNYTSSVDKGKCLSRIGHSCQNNDVCIENAYCNSEYDSYTCKCNDGFKANTAGDQCFSKGRLGETCGDSSQCGFWEVCSGGVCKCDADHAVTGGNATCGARLGKSCESSEDCFNRYTTCFNDTCKCLEGYEEKSGLCKGRNNYLCVSNEDCADVATTCKQMNGVERRCACNSNYRYDQTKGSCVSGSCGLDIFSATFRALAVVYITTFVKSVGL